MVGVVIALMLAAMAGGGYYFLRRTPSDIDSVAVLPLANATSNSELDYLADGITEGVINQSVAVAAVAGNGSQYGFPLPAGTAGPATDRARPQGRSCDRGPPYATRGHAERRN